MKIPFNRLLAVTAAILACVAAAPFTCSTSNAAPSGASSGIPAAAAADAPLRSELTLAQNLHADAEDANARRVPLLLVFTTRNCPYCARARRQYLGPISTEPAYRGKVIVREIDAGSSAALTDFTGHPASHAALARGYKVTRVPTLIVVDGEGKVLADPVIGLLGSDFYGAYIDNAIDQGIANLRAR